jgi:hypothetical protein
VHILSASVAATTHALCPCSSIESFKATVTYGSVYQYKRGEVRNINESMNEARNNNGSRWYQESRDLGPLIPLTFANVMFFLDRFAFA